MGNKQAKSKQQKSTSNIDFEKIIKELTAGGDVEIARKIINSFKDTTKGKNVLDKFLDWQEKTGVLGTATETGLNILDGIASVLELAKPLTDAIQVAGIAFGFASTVLDLVKGFKEVNSAVENLYVELVEYCELLARLTEIQQTSRKQIDDNSKASFNATADAILECYRFISKYNDKSKLIKFFTQGVNKKRVDDLKENLSKTRIQLHSNLILYLTRTAVSKLESIVDTDAREIWKSINPDVVEQPTGELMAAMRKHSQEKFQIKWDSNLEERVKQDLDINKDGQVHFDELNTFTRVGGGLKAQLEYYSTNPSFSRSRQVLETDKIISKYIMLSDGIGTQKRSKSELYHPGTRKQIISKVEDWLVSGKNNLFCIEAAAGIGKSVISYQIVTRNANSCIGYFFFEFNDQDRKSVIIAAQSLLRQISEKFPEAKEYIVKQLEEESKRNKIINSTSSLLKELLLGALRKIPKDSSQNYFILFDALDETNLGEREALLLFFKELNKDKSLSVKVIVTTRPESDIMTKFTEYSLPLEHIDKFDQMNTEDIRIYAKSLVKHFSTRLQDKGKEEEFEQLLVDRSQNVFLWMSLAKEWMNEQDDLISFKEITERLPNGLDDTYRDFFRRVVEKREQKQIEVIFDIIKIISTSFEPLNFTQIAWLLGITDNAQDEIAIENFRSLVESLQSLFPPDSKSYYSPIHKSVSDFIEKNRKELIKEYKVQGFLKEQVNQRIVDRMIHQFNHPKDGPSFDLHKLQELFYQLNDIYPLPKGKEDSWTEKWEHNLPSKYDFPPSEMYLCFQYAIKYFFQHLQQAGKSENNKSLWKLILEFFYIKYCTNIQAPPLIDAEAIKLKLEKDIATFFRQYHHVFTATPFAIFQYACTYEPLRAIALDWGNTFNQTHNDKVAWLNLPILNSTCIQTLVGHNEQIYCCAISPDQKWIVSGSKDETLKIWNSITGELLHTLSGHTNDIYCCAISPDGKWIVSGSNDETLKIWNLTTGELLNTLSEHTNSVNCCAISPDGKWIVSGSDDKTLKIWNSTTGELLNTLSEDNEQIYCCAISPDSKWIVSGSDDNTLKIWNLTGELLHTLSEHTNTVKCCAISPDSKWIVSGSEDETLKIWNSTTGELLHTLSGHTNSVTCCAISLDGKWIVSGSLDKTLKIWNSVTGELLHTLNGHTNGITCSAISLDSKWIVSGSEDETLKIWNSAMGELLHTLSGHTNWVNCFTISPDGKWIVSGSEDETLKIWNLTGELLHTLSGHTNSVSCCAISSDSKWIVSGSNDKTLKIWNSTTGELLHTLSGHTSYITCCAISPDSKWIVSGSWDHTFKIWNSTTGELLHALSGHTDYVTCCAISPNGKWIVSGSYDKTLRIWNSTTGELLHTLSGHTSYVTRCSISLDGKWIVSGSLDKTLKIWNSTTGELLHTLSGHTNSVTCCAISPDSKWIVSGSEDKTFKIWNSTTGELVHTVKCVVIDLWAADAFCFASSGTMIYRINPANTKHPTDKRYLFFGKNRFAIQSGISCVFPYHDGIYFPVFCNLNELETTKPNELDTLK